MNGPAPKARDLLRVYPPRYLESLRDIWQSQWAQRALDWHAKVKALPSPVLADIPPVPTLPGLRRAQRQAFELLKHKVGFLWGPPGTGKSFTLGTVVAQFLTENPKARILLLSTTNSAVDDALIYVASGLDALAKVDGRAHGLPKRCKRIGSHFIASKYEPNGRHYLLPEVDDKLLRQLAELEVRRPDLANLDEYHRWKMQVEKLRRRLPRPLDHNNIVAMTTTYAAFIFDELRQRGPYDLVAFDEASQVSLAYATALAPLGERVIFAGDPQQLASIAKSDSEWLRHSVFDAASSRPECFLNEQTRMHDDICKVAGGVFYVNKGLRVAAMSAGEKQQWLSKRHLQDVPPAGKRRVYLHRISGEYDPVYPAKYPRQESAEFIVNFFANCLDESTADQILVLTPFRKQRQFLRTRLLNAGITKVRVTTVHRAQGSECHTVIFDPVAGNCGFLTSQETGRRLINVALSRAMARFVMVVSPNDLKNIWIRQIANIVDGGAIPRLLDVVNQPGFPHRCLNELIDFNGIIGQIIEISSCGKKFHLRDGLNPTRIISIPHVRQLAAAAAMPLAYKAEAFVNIRLPSI